MSGMDGAHEVALPELAAGLSAKASGYRYPGPVLAAWLEAELTATLGPLAANAAGVRERVAGHWGLGAGWSERVLWRSRWGPAAAPANAAVTSPPCAPTRWPLWSTRLCIPAPSALG